MLNALLLLVETVALLAFLIRRWRIPLGVSLGVLSAWILPAGWPGAPHLLALMAILGIAGLLAGGVWDWAVEKRKRSNPRIEKGKWRPSRDGGRRA